MNFLATRRSELGLTQRQIALALNMTETTVSAWERDFMAPRLKLAPIIAAAYQTTREVIEQEIVSMSRRISARQQQQAATA